jgi:hypothetical protein
MRDIKSIRLLGRKDLIRNAIGIPVSFDQNYNLMKV